MFRQTHRAALVALAALGTLTTAAAQTPRQADRGETQITSSIGMRLTLVPSGEFTMGSSESGKEMAAFFKKNYRIPDELVDLSTGEIPQHRVRITRPFYLGTYHVTRGQFRQFVKDSGYKTDAEKGDKPGAFDWGAVEGGKLVFKEGCSWRNTGFEQTDEHPVVNVSWNDAMAFCRWLSKKERETYRLPTEAEWEYACRAGTKTRYYCGDDPETLAKSANVADAAFRAKFPNSVFCECTVKANDGYVFTAPVGQFKPNAFGLYDMLGNAWQYCADRTGIDYYAESPTDDPKGPDSGDDRVIRGGCWYSCPALARSAVRSTTALDYPSNGTGFRVARAAPR
jgi:formylglycine-generating enzyme required for sulfatase activity